MINVLMIQTVPMDSMISTIHQMMALTIQKMDFKTILFMSLTHHRKSILIPRWISTAMEVLEQMEMKKNFTLGILGSRICKTADPEDPTRTLEEMTDNQLLMIHSHKSSFTQSNLFKSLTLSQKTVKFQLNKWQKKPLK